MSGLSNALEGSAQLLTKAKIGPNELDSAVAYIRNDIDGFPGVAFDMVQDISTELPSMLITKITGKPSLGLISSGISSTGNAYRTASNDGYSEREAKTYAALTGASEIALGYIMNGIGYLEDEKVNRILKNLTDKADSASLRIATQLGEDIFSESVERGLQPYLETAFKNIVFDENNKLRDVDEESLYNGMLGAIETFLLEGFGEIAATH